MKVLLKSWVRNSIRSKLIIYFLLIALLMGMTSMYSYYNARIFIKRMDVMFTSNVFLDKLQNNVNLVENHLEKYLSTKNSESLKEYFRYSSEMKTMSEHIRNVAWENESSLLMKDIGNMIDTYLAEADAAVSAKRGRNINDYIMHYTEASKVARYISIYINRLNTEQFRENTSRYIMVSERLGITQIFNIVIFITAVLLSFILILLFTYNITKPIIELSKSANEISGGNFDVDEVVVTTDDELSIMANAFNRMIASIRAYIDEIKGKAQLEGRLKEQEMQNLMIKNLLKEAELQALQSQINPHFIFNTLNAGVHIAMMEGAVKTCTFMENVAGLFRYNIRRLDKPVTLKEEIANINNYIYVLKARFGNKMDYCEQIQMDISEKGIDDIRMPSMILQPLVENAFIHGIADMESGGVIALKVSGLEDTVHITIEDNGKGMDKNRLLEVLGDGDKNSSRDISNQTGHTTGIGMNNVINRLKLFFNKEDIVDIDSNPGEGTRIIISIPLKKQGGSDGIV